MSFQKILVAIDDSVLGSAVFTAALELALSNQAVIKLLHCISVDVVTDPTASPTFDVGLSLGALNNNDYQTYQTQQMLMERQIETAEAVLKRYHDEATRHGVPVESNYEVGEAGHKLCEAAKDWGADLVVVGRQGLTGLSEALLGSVSNYVVHHAPCSVLVIQKVEPELQGQTVSDRSLEVINPTPSQELA